MRSQVEYALHVAVADYLRAVLDPSVLWSTIGHGGGGKIRGGKLKRAGLRAGIADLMICWLSPMGPRTLWIELKSAKGRVSDEQIRFRDDAAGVGHWYAVARSIAEVETQLRINGIPIRGRIAA